MACVFPEPDNPVRITKRRVPRPRSTVFVFTYETYNRRDADPFHLFKFNQNLSLLWQKPLQLPRGCKLLATTAQNKILYLLFEGAKRDEFQLIRINTQTSEQFQTTHLLPEDMTFTLTALEALQGKLFLTGLQNDRLTVLHLDPERGSALDQRVGQRHGGLRARQAVESSSGVGRSSRTRAADQRNAHSSVFLCATLLGRRPHRAGCP